MPIPQPEKNEDTTKYVSRCMSNETMKKDYPDNKQRVAVCLGQTKSSLIEQVCETLAYEDLDDEDEEGEEVTKSNLIIPEDNDYVDAQEETEDFELHTISSEYQGRKVTLNKPFRTPGGPKKSAVYVKNDKGKVVIVRFGDPNMKIKKNIPGRRKNFRARHNCDNPGPKWKARYWSCKAW
jgi:hypothetical protein